MATKVNFAYGNSVPTGLSQFTDGTLYFSSTNKNIYMKQGGKTTIFDGNNTTNVLSSTVYSHNKVSYEYAATYIQNAPQSINNSYTSSISGAISWYSLFGQGNLSSTTLVDTSYQHDYSIDEAYSYNTVEVPSLALAHEIILAVDLINLAKASTNGTSVTNSSHFGFTPADAIIHCYRTTASNQSTCDTTSDSGTAGKEMFFGKLLLGLGNNTSSSSGSTAELCSLQISLCPNASNAVKLIGRIFHIATASDKNTSVSFNATSAKYAYDYDEQFYYSNIEKHLYPLYIRYI